MAGLDPEDVSNLLRSRLGFGQLEQRGIETTLGERARRLEALERNQARIANLKAAATTRVEKERVRKLEAQAKIDAEALKVTEKKDIAATLAESKLTLEDKKASLRAKAAELTPNELALENLEIQKLTKELEDLEAGKTPELTPANIIAQKRLDIAQRSEARGIAEKEIADQDFILDPETPRAQAEAQARRENNKVDADQVFYNAIDAPWFGKNTDVMDVWQIPDDLIFQGQRVTPPMLIQLAEQRGVTLQELITALEGQ